MGKYTAGLKYKACEAEILLEKITMMNELQLNSRDGCLTSSSHFSEFKQDDGLARHHSARCSGSTQNCSGPSERGTKNINLWFKDETASRAIPGAICATRQQTT